MQARPGGYEGTYSIISIIVFITIKSIKYIDIRRSLI